MPPTPPPQAGLRARLHRARTPLGGLLLAWAASLLLGAGAATAQPAPAGAPLTLRIVGGLASLNQYTRQEEPFWTQRLPALTNGRVRAEVVPFDRAGIRGQDMLRLLQAGVVPFGTALLSVSATEDPLVGLVDLPGVNPDIATLRRAVAAFRPLLARHLQQALGVELLAIYAYPAQVTFCRQPFATLADLAGRRVRVSSAPQADFVEALGALPVLTPFAEIKQRLHSGELDCVITGTMSGNTIGLHEATSHLHTLPVTWGLSLFAAGRAAWTGLPPDVRQTLQRELPLLEQAIWADAERDTGEGVACNAGSETCQRGRRGRMTVVQPAAADRERLRALLARSVLPRWIARCGPPCAEAWDSHLAPAVGLRPHPVGR